MSGKTWTENELSLLEQLYPKMTNSRLANEVFDDRSKGSISRKARRLGMEKENNFQFKQKIRNNDPPEKDEDFEMFLLGLMCAEGSFINTDNGDREKFILKIEMNMKNNEPMFEDIKEYVGVGKLSSYTRRGKRIQRYTVRSIPTNVSVICPIMERNQLPVDTWRVKQYKNWKRDMIDYIRTYYGEDCYELSTQVIQNAE